MEEKLCSFYGKLTYQSIGKGNYAVFMGNYLLNKVLERKLCSFYGKLPLNKVLEEKLCSFYRKLTSNQSIGRETTQFLWEIYLPKYWKGNYAV